MTHKRTALSAVAILGTAAFLTPGANAQSAKPDPQMQAVLNELKSLNGKPIQNLSPSAARKQPLPADAVKSLLKKQGKSTDPMPVGMVYNRLVPGPSGTLPVRVYVPEGTGPFPVVVYYHGGGWVIAGIQPYDASCRALAKAANAVVVSVGYRYAPENPFPAAHEDAYTALQYIMKNADQFNGDPNRVAVAGESAGGNLAASVCLMAKEREGMMPVYQVLIYPVTDSDTRSASYSEHARAVPLNRPMMTWFFRHTLDNRSDRNSKYLDLLRAPSLKELPPATVITADIDPLRTDGQEYAARLKNAGVKVDYKNYDGVTHEFFGMGAVVDKANDAVARAARGLKMAFDKAPAVAATPETTAAPVAAPEASNP
ncbi:MAG: alpha/beta hydrolase [Armatimonadaceae bacterium]